MLPSLCRSPHVAVYVAASVCIRLCMAGYPPVCLSVCHSVCLPVAVSATLLVAASLVPAPVMAAAALSLSRCCRSLPLCRPHASRSVGRSVCRSVCRYDVSACCCMCLYPCMGRDQCHGLLVCLCLCMVLFIRRSMPRYRSLSMPGCSLCISV